MECVFVGISVWACRFEGTLQTVVSPSAFLNIPRNIETGMKTDNSHLAGAIGNGGMTLGMPLKEATFKGWFIGLLP